MRSTPKSILRSAWLAAIVLLGSGCAYFNTFYNAQQYYREGVRYKEGSQAGQAKAKLDKAIEKSALVISRWPKSQWVDDALYLIGMSYFHEGQYAKAMRHFDQLTLAFPESRLVPDAELQRGLTLLKDRQYGQARIMLEGVRDRHRRLADAAAFHLAQSLVEREEHVAAVDSLAEFVRTHPRSKYVKQATLLLAEGCYRLERWAEAEGWFTKYSRLENDAKKRFGAELKVAACRYEQGQYERVVNETGDVLGRYSDYDDEAYLLLGRALAHLGRNQEAVAAWAKVRTQNAEGAEAAFLVGKYYEEGAQFDKARAYYDTARARRTDSDYGVLAVKRLSLLDALAKRDTSNQDPAEAAFLLAEVHNLNLGDYDRAMKLYQAVYDSFPTSDWGAKALFTTAWILRCVRADTAAAEPVLRKVIAEFPETEYADESRRWLGLPVPKRKVVQVKPPAETLATRPDTLVTIAPPDTAAPAKPDEVSLLDSGPGMPARPYRPGQVPQPMEPADPAAPGQVPGQTTVVPPPTPAGPGQPSADDATGQMQLAAADTLPAPPAEPETAGPAPEPGPAKAGFEPVHFETDSWRILPEDTASLRTAAARLIEMAGTFTLEGYCDPRGTEQHNDTLGLKRARAVQDWLATAGVPAERLVAVTRGETGLLSTRPEEYWKDRRVEFEVK